MALDVRGKTVVLTGTFNRLRRAEAEARLVALGAKIGSGVSKSTHVLFAGEKAGSKIDKAGSLGVTVLGEDDLMTVLRGDTAAAADEDAAPFAGLNGGLSAAKLMAAIEELPWDDFAADRDFFDLRAALLAHEAKFGVTVAHQAATRRLRPQLQLKHAHGHDVEVEWAAMSPDGRYLATGSWVGDDYHRGGVLQIWDVAVGRCVNMLRVSGGVGWSDEADCVQWRPDGRRIGLSFDTNGVGSFDPFGRLGEPESCVYITDGWSRPPAWAWAANSRDVYVACWGPDLAYGAIVPLIGRSPEPRWCATVERADPDDSSSEPRLQPLKAIWWHHPDRIVGVSNWSQVVALDVRTGALLWDGPAQPPVALTPDGDELIMHPDGLAYYDAATGQPRARPPLHVSADEFVWSPDGRCVAVIVQPQDEQAAKPGIFVYERGVLRHSLDVPGPPTNGRYDAVWRADGRRLAITSGGRLQVWELGDRAVRALDVAAPGASVLYGADTLVLWGSFGLTFVREADGRELGEFQPAIEASAETPLMMDGVDWAAGSAWNPAFPLDAERVAALLPEGVVIGPSGAAASIDEIDGKIAWVLANRYAWPWRWGEPKVWPDAAAASADKAAPRGFKNTFARVKPAAKTNAAKTWPPPGGSLDEIVQLLVDGVRDISDSHHGNDYRRKLAVRTMALGLFDRAAQALDGGREWPKWGPWWSAYARGEVVVTALTRRIDGAPALTPEQTKTLRRWLNEGETALAKRDPAAALCRPQALLGAGWALLGEAARGETLLAAAVAGMLPEHNRMEHREVVATAFAALGRIDEAIDHLTADEATSLTFHPSVVVAITRRASAAELVRLFDRLRAQSAHNEFILLERGLDRLIELREWDAAKSWISGFDGLSTRHTEGRLIAALVAAGEPARGEAVSDALAADDPHSAELVRDLARVAPERARPHFERLLARAAALVADAHYPDAFVAALASAAVRLARLDAAAELEARASSPGLAQSVRVAVLTELAPTDPAWPAWYARSLVGTTAEQLFVIAALAVRGGVADADIRLDAAIAAARAASYADIRLEELSGKLAAVGDLNGAHRAWLAIARGKRSYRVKPLLDACRTAEAWGGALELLKALPNDLNGAPKVASQLLEKLAGGEGW